VKNGPSSRILFFIACCSSACADPPDEERTSDEVLGGRTDDRHVAVGQIGHASSGEVRWICTGTLIGPRTVLTAAHCLVGASEDLVRPEEVRFSTEGWVYLASRVAIAAGYDPDSAGPWDDLGIVSLDEAPAVEPIPFSRAAPDVSTRAAVIGFGVTRASGPGTGRGAGRRRRATIMLGAVFDREIEYEVEERGACYGDSGGPIVQRIGGRERVVGVTSRGTHWSCRGTDIATRADSFSSWISETAGERLPGS
jgi:secreted trypsin-like serine protease